METKTLTQDLEASQAALEELADHSVPLSDLTDGFELDFSDQEVKSNYNLYGNYGRGWAHC
jgi:hypothetical protein